VADSLRKPLLRKGHLLSTGPDMYSYTNLLDDDNAAGPNDNEDNDVALIIALILVTITSSRNHISLCTNNQVVHTSVKSHVRGLLSFCV